MIGLVIALVIWGLVIVIAPIVAGVWEFAVSGLIFFGLVLAGIISAYSKPSADDTGSLPKEIRKGLGHWF